MNELKKKSVAFIGIGVMGKSMAGHILANGHTLYVYNRTKEKADELVKRGAIWCSSPAEAARKAEIVITMVGFPQDVEDIYLGAEGLLENGSSGSIMIDMTTSSPKLAEQIYEAGLQKGISCLDAPVSGGDVGAREAKLSIMVGGDEQTFEIMKPLFEYLGTNIVYHGKAGNGQYAKMCNQIAVASTMLSICESLAYAEKAGLDTNLVLKSIQSGAAGSWAMSNLAPRILNDDFAPGFYIKHFVKDLRIALQSAEEMNLHLPAMQLAKSLYEQLENAGEGSSGTQALFKWYREKNDQV